MPLETAKGRRKPPLIALDNQTLPEAFWRKKKPQNMNKPEIDIPSLVEYVHHLECEREYWLAQNRLLMRQLRELWPKTMTAPKDRDEAKETYRELVRLYGSPPLWLPDVPAESRKLLKECDRWLPTERDRRDALGML